MATNYKDFSSKKGLIAEDGAITSKKAHGIVLQNNSNNTVSLKPAGTTADYTLTFPATAGTSQQFLQTDGSGNLTWADASASLSGLDDTSISGLTGGNFLKYDATGGAWINSNIVWGDIYSTPTTLAGYSITDAVSTTSSQALASGTALSISGDTLTLTKGDGSTNTVDLSVYLDEDARAIASGSLDAGTGIVTFTRDDTTTFTLDLSALLDDTNLVTSVAGKAGVVTLEINDMTDVLIDTPAIGQVLFYGDGGWGNAQLSFGNLANKPTTLSGYGITDAATSAQGALADSAVQPGDNVSDLTNDANYVSTGADISVFNNDSGYITGYTETDTLATVTGRGATTTNDISVGEVTTTGGSNSATLTSDTTFTGDAAKMIITVVDTPNNLRTVSEILVTHNNVDVFITEYGTTFTSSNMISDISGSVTGTGDVTITVTPTVGTVKVATVYVS